MKTTEILSYKRQSNFISSILLKNYGGFDTNLTV